MGVGIGKIEMSLLDVLYWVRLGIDNGNVSAARRLLQDLIDQVEDAIRRGDKRPILLGELRHYFRESDTAADNC